MININSLEPKLVEFLDGRSIDNDSARENGNINADTAMGKMLKVGSETSKALYLNDPNFLSERFAKAHKRGEIHIHDLDFLAETMTCCQIDIAKILKDGFNTGHGSIRPPKTIRTAAALAAIVIQSNQNDQHGGQSIANFDHGLAPYVEKTFVKLFKDLVKEYLEFNNVKIINGLKDYIDSLNHVSMDYDKNEYDEIAYSIHEMLPRQSVEMSPTKIKQIYDMAFEKTDEETYQAMEAMLHNLNTMASRAGSQVPFSSINYGLNTTTAGRMIIRNLLLSTMEGLGFKETAIFPIQIFRLKKGISRLVGDPNYDLFQLACDVSSKRLFPNFLNVDASYNLKYYLGTPETEVAAMGCRTRVLANTYDPKRSISFGRGNLSFTSINLPRLALESARDVIGSDRLNISSSDEAISSKQYKYVLNEFFNRLDNSLDLVKDQLLERFERQCKLRVANFPFLMGQGVWIDSEKLKSEDEIRSILGHGTLSIGFIGLAETLKVLTGHHHGQTEFSQRLGLEIVKHMRDYCDEMATTKRLNFSLIGTPAEGLCGRFLRIDKNEFGVIEGVTDHEYYTNSFHIPVYHQVDVYGKIDKEAPYHALTNAGHISYIETDGNINANSQAFMEIVNYMCDKDMGYMSINHPVDQCPECDYVGVINDECPRCHVREKDIGHFKRIRRITGYLVGSLERFNDGKYNEVMDRVKHC